MAVTNSYDKALPYVCCALTLSKLGLQIDTPSTAGAIYCC